MAKRGRCVICNVLTDSEIYAVIEWQRETGTSTCQESWTLRRICPICQPIALGHPLAARVVDTREVQRNEHGGC